MSVHSRGRKKILNPKQHFFFLEKRIPVLKEKIIVSLVKKRFVIKNGCKRAL